MEITVQELKARLDAGEDITVIDVREPYEYEEMNIGVPNIPLGELAFRTDELGDKSSEIIMLCRSGARSGNAQKLLSQLGFTNVINMKGGMLAWQEAFGAQ